MNAFSALYLLLGLQLLAVELYGIARNGKLDTISEHWWAFQQSNPILARIIYFVFFIWLTIHFIWHKSIH